MADVSKINGYNIKDATARSAITNLTASSIATSATNVTVQDAINTLNGKTVLYFTSVPCSATTGDFATISNASITANHVVAECYFADSSAISSAATWTTSAGSLVLNGTCSTATTANIVLVCKDN